MQGKEKFKSLQKETTQKTSFFHKKLVVLRKLKNTTMKHILGLDLGTNSIGWAVINAIKEENTQKE